MKLLRNTWQRLFPPPAVTDTKRSVLDLIERHSGICRPHVERRVAQDIANRKFLIYAVEEKGSPPEVLAMMIVRNALEELICHGQFHVYRGTLSQIGIDMMNTLRGFFAEMKSAGEMADVSEEDYFKFINESIKSAG